MKVNANTKRLPSYDQPPVSEVVCSVQFDFMEKFISPHIGLLWQRFQPDYPFCEDLPPLTEVVELFNNQDGDNQLKLNDPLPSLPRVLFINSDATKIVQVQRDRLIYNWRKVDSSSEYPRYHSLVTSFQEHLNRFSSFVAEADLGEIQISQYELTYSNKIPQGEAWKTLEDVGEIFPGFKWQTESSPFILKLKKINWNATFDLPEEFGELYVSLKNTVFDDHPTLSFELTICGIGDDTSLEAMRTWFDAAHKLIVEAFADLTNETIQVNVWKRTE